MASVTGFHLQYRLWIAELNNDINILRIFDDYLADIATTNNNEYALSHIKNCKQQFSDLRKNIDELRHDMHINKMELGAIAKQAGTSIKIIEKNIKHKEVKERYKHFRKTFDRTKKDFQKFENKLKK
ncbi:MAG: hypothetical protein ABJB05_14320 [Parafilimonas sp.]